MGLFALVVIATEALIADRKKNYASAKPLRTYIRNVRNGDLYKHYTIESKLEGHTEFAGINQSSPKSNRFFPVTIQTIPENLVQIRSPVL